MPQFLYHLKEILPVLVLEHRGGIPAHPLLRDPSLAVGDPLKTRNLQSLTLLYHLYEGGCLGKRVVRAGVEPREATTECLHLQLSILEEPLVDGRDLQLTACRRPDVLRHMHHLVGIEVETNYGIVGFRMLRFLLYGETVTLAVELRHAVTLRVADPIAEDGCLPVLLG